MNTTKRILYAEDVMELRELNKYIFEHYFDVEIVEAKNSIVAIDILTKDSNFDLIISDFNMSGGNGDEIYQHLRDKNMNIPFVLLTGAYTDSNPQLSKVPQYKKPLENEQVFKIIDEQLPSVVRRAHEYYVPVSSNLLSMISDLNADIYVKINEGRFVKIYRKGTRLDSGEIAKHARKGILVFYIVAAQFPAFIGEYQQKMLLAESWTEASVLAFDESLNINAELMRSLGEKLANSKEFSEHLINQVTTAIKLISQDEQFRFLINRFSNKEDVSYTEHCSLIIYTAGTLLRDYPGIDFESALRSICLAALIHDAPLDDRLFKMKRELISKGIYQNLEKGSEDYKLIYTHPFRAAELARKIKYCPEEVQTIVVQHHELPNGRGFPLGCESTELHPLSIFFIVAEDFVENYLASNGMIDAQYFIQTRSKLYNEVHFDVVFASLKSKLLVSH